MYPDLQESLVNISGLAAGIVCIAKPMICSVNFLYVCAYKYILHTHVVVRVSNLDRTKLIGFGYAKGECASSHDSVWFNSVQKHRYCAENVSNAPLKLCALLKNHTHPLFYSAPCLTIYFIYFMESSST